MCALSSRLYSFINMVKFILSHLLEQLVFSINPPFTLVLNFHIFSLLTQKDSASLIFPIPHVVITSGLSQDIS